MIPSGKPHNEMILADDLEDIGQVIDEAALPVVLLLLDQLHDLRRRMRELGSAIEQTTPNNVRAALLQHLSQMGIE